MVAGGLEQQICYLLQGMDRQRYKPMLAVWNYRESDVNIQKVRALGVPIWGYAVSASSYRKLYEVACLARFLRPEVVHSYSFYTNLAAYVAASAAGAVGVGSIRGESNMATFIDYRPLSARLSAMFPRFQISNSHAARQRIVGTGGWFTPKRMCVVPNGLDMNRFQEAAAPAGPPYRILGVGALSEVKRWDRLIRVAAELKRRRIDCMIQIAGDGELRAQLETLAQKLDVVERVQFLGHREDVPKLIAEAHAVVHTSDAEGTPNVVMEAFASGRPVVATDVGDVRKLVEDGSTGYVVARDDENLLVSRIASLLEDHGLARAMGLRAMDYARREFGLERLVEQTLAAYADAGWKA